MSALLSEHSPLWKRSMARMLSAWLLRRLGVEREDWLTPAALDFVYDDDAANMPVHYVALGAPVSMCAISSTAIAEQYPCCLHAQIVAVWGCMDLAMCICVLMR